MDAKKPCRAVFLDRDGTINRMVYYPEHGIVDSPFVPSQLELLPDVPQALRLLRRKGFLLILASNQPGIAKGHISEADFWKMERRLDRLLARQGARLDAKYYSFYHGDAKSAKYRKGASLRKPRPGMLLSAARELGIDLSRSYMVGDGAVDVQAGRAAGCRTVFVGRLKPEMLERLGGALPDIVAPGLLAAAKKIR